MPTTPRRSWWRGRTAFSAPILASAFLAAGLSLLAETAFGGGTACSHEISGSISQRVGNFLTGPSRLEGVPQIPVRLLDSKATREVAETRTNAAGEFAFAGLCTGTYVVCPGTPCPAGDHSRYSPPSRRVKVSRSNATGVSFELQERGGKAGDPSDVEDPTLVGRTDDPRWAREQSATESASSVRNLGSGGLAEGAKEGPVLPTIERDLELEGSISERHRSAVAALPPEAKKEFSRASREFVEELVKRYREANPEKLAHAVLRRHFTGLTREQRELLTLCLLAEVVQTAADPAAWDLRARKIRKTLESKNAEDEEIEMLEINGLLSKRSQVMSLASQMLSASNQTATSILGNVGN